MRTNNAWVPAWAPTILWFAAASASAATAAAAEEPERQDQEEPAGYFHRHKWHFAVAGGMKVFSDQYDYHIGPSTDPLLFDDPPVFDRMFRDLLMEEGHERPYLLDVPYLNIAGAFSAAIFSHLGEEKAGRWIADDITGIIEAYYFNEGATELVKNLIGRERPEIEYIDEEEDLTPEEREEELAKDTNHQSFFSGATSRNFTLMSYADAIVASRVKTRKARVASFMITYGFAAAIGIDRIRADKHYMTDVVVGAAAGTMVGRSFFKAHRDDGKRKDRRVRFHSLAPVEGGGLQVMFAIRTGPVRLPAEAGTKGRS